MRDNFNEKADALLDASYTISARDVSPANARRLADQKRRIDKILDPKGTRMSSNISADDIARRVRAANADAAKRLRHIPQTPAERAAERQAVHTRNADLSATVEAYKNTLPLSVKEGRIYHPGAAHSFTRDVAAAAGGDPDAQARLRRNNAEYGAYMQAAGVNQTAGTGGEFLPPVWIVEQTAQQLRPGRPFLDALGTRPLPRLTNQIDIPKFTSGGSAAVQTDASAVSNTDPVTTSLTGQVQTVAGRTIVSSQVHDLSPASDQVVTQDLTFAIDTNLDNSALNSTVTNAKGLVQASGTNAVTFTSATPKATDYWIPTSQANAQIGKNGFGRADFGITHPSIVTYISSAQDAQGLPVYDEETPPDGLPVAGVPILADANIPVTLGGGSNESRLILVNRASVFFYESPIYIKLADEAQTGTLQLTFMAYCYYAILVRQVKLVSIVSGTGMVPQVGWA